MLKFHQERLDEDNLLGSGASGEVFPYQKNPQDLRWVVKRILAKNIDQLINCFPEVVLGFACDHPCVVPVKGFFVEKIPNPKYFHVYLKIPRMKETLSKHLKDRKRRNVPFTEKEIIQHFYSLTCGLRYLHSKKIYHGDIRHDNLLLDEQGNLKIADVGIAKHVEEEDSYQTITGQKGTYEYSAPEILGRKAQKKQLPKADIWSLGVVIFELCALDNRLFNSALPQDQLQNTLNELFRKVEGRVQEGLIAFIRKLISLDPADRPDLDQIKDYLEKNFNESINKDLFSFESSRLGKIGNESEIKSAELDQHIKEISEKYEAETRLLKGRISELDLELVQQKQEYEDQIKSHQNKAREEHSKEKSENLALQAQIKGLEKELDLLKTERQEQSENTNLKVQSLEEQIQMLERDKISFEQRNKDLSDQMKADKDQIKALQESQLKEKTQFDQEKKKLLENLDALRSKLEDERNFKKAVLKLRENWNNVFKFEEKDGKLKITRNELESKYMITDEDVSRLSKDLIEVLGENHLFNLFGLEIDTYWCHKLTDKVLEYVATALSNQALHLQHLTLNFVHCKELTDKALEYVATALSNQALHLQHLTLNFERCRQLTDKALEHVATALSNQALNLQHLTLDFSWIPISDLGVEKIATTIQGSCLNLQDLRLEFQSIFGSPNKVTQEMKMSLQKRFAHIPNLKIS